MAHVSSMLQSNGTMDTKSKLTFVLLGHPFLLVCLITCLFAPLCAFFPCLSVLCVCLMLSLFLCYLFCLFASFVFFLFIFYCCMYTFGVRAQLLKCKLKKEKMQAKGANLEREMISRLGGLAPPCGFLFLSIFFRTMFIAF